VDQGTGRTRDDLTPPTKAKLNPVDPVVKTAVGAEMTPHSTVLICCPLAQEFNCVRDELKKLWSSARSYFESTKRDPQVAEFARMQAALLEVLPEEFVRRFGDKIDAQFPLAPMPKLGIPNVTCRLRRKRLLVIQSGLGLTTMQTASPLLERVDAVWLVGFAGALDPNLTVGDILEPRAVVSGARDDSGIDLATTGICANSRPIVTSQEIVSTPAEKAALRDKTKCAAVDMEAFELASVCQALGKPFHTARSISDAADEAFPMELSGIIKPSGSLSLGRLAWAVLKKPSLIGPLSRLRRGSVKVEDGLRRIVQRLVESAA
jgi:nucleoside phosphorylase